MPRFSHLRVGGLLLALVLSSPAQVLLNEVDTGNVDAGEIFNTGVAAVNLNGWRSEYGAIDTTLTWITSNFAIGNVTLPAGGRLVIREGTGVTVAPGALVLTQTANIPWPTSGPGLRGGDWVLVNAANQGVDMVIWNNPPGANNFFGATFAGSLLPSGATFFRNSNLDTDTTADWSNGPTTFGLVNPGQTDPTVPIFTVTATTNGLGSLNWQVTSGNPTLPGAQIQNLISLQDIEPDGSGPLFGVGLDALVELTIPEAPWRVNLNGAGIWSLALPSGVVPAGIHAEFVAFVLDPVQGVTRISPVTTLDF